MIPCTSKTGDVPSCPATAMRLVYLGNHCATAGHQACRAKLAPESVPLCLPELGNVIRTVVGTSVCPSRSYLPSVPPQLAPPRTCTSPAVVLAAYQALLTCPQAQYSLGCIIWGHLISCNSPSSPLPRPGPRPHAMWLRGLVWCTSWRATKRRRRKPTCRPPL